MFEAAEFCSGEIQLRDEDRVVLFTDGLLEAHDSDGEEFGAKRILNESLTLRESDAGVILDGLFASVREFGGRVFEDDATVVVLAVSAIPD